MLLGFNRGQENYAMDKANLTEEISKQNEELTKAQEKKVVRHIRLL